MKTVVFFAVVLFPVFANAQDCLTCQVSMVRPASVFVEQKVQTVQYQPVIVETTQVVEYVPKALDIGCLSQAVSSFANCRSNGGRFLACAAEGFANYVSCSGVGGVRARARFRRTRRAARAQAYYAY